MLLKKKVGASGLMRVLKIKKAAEKPSEVKKRKRVEVMKRVRIENNKRKKSQTKSKRANYGSR